MTRGFITLATGKDMYYEFAKNLLLSYKLYCDHPFPFAIMCDRENDITAMFDDVVLLDHPTVSYFDKFELLVKAPYDETIFIDSDCLAYDNLNDFWKYFENADDFSAAGTNYPLDSDRGLFNYEEIGDYRSRVACKPDIHGGLYFIRRGEICNAIYQDSLYIAQHYNDFRWPDYCAPNADEPVLCLAMAANGCKATDAAPNNYGIPWEVTEMDCDLFTGKLTYATDWHPKVSQGHMIHWSVRYCKKPLYKFEVEKLYLMLENDLKPSKISPLHLSWKNRLLYQYKLRLYWMLSVEFAGRVARKLKRVLKIK